MDPLTVSMVAGALDKFLGSAAAEAGKGVWSGLVRLVRSRFPEHGDVVRAAEELAPGGAAQPAQGAVIDLSAELVGLAKGDPEFAAGLRAWLDEAARVSVRTGDTYNDFSGIARNVVQARDTGPNHLG
jgi:hypothetical protein